MSMSLITTLKSFKLITLHHTIYWTKNHHDFDFQTIEIQQSYKLIRIRVKPTIRISQLALDGPVIAPHPKEGLIGRNRPIQMLKQ